MASEQNQSNVKGKEMSGKLVTRMIFQQWEIVDFRELHYSFAQEIADKYGLIVNIYEVETEGTSIVRHDKLVTYRPKENQK